MSDSLRDQLLGLGFKPAPKPERSERKPDERRGGKPGGARADAKPGARPGQPRHDARKPGGPRPDGARADGRPSGGHKPGGAKPGQGRPGQGRPGQGKPRTREDIDLAKAYAIRAQREKEERIAAEQAKQEEARLRREARAKLAELLKDQALNVADAEIARHFPYGGKIKRIYVTEAQLKQLNAGELGVVQMEGRYVLVTAAMLAQAEAVFAPAVALKVDPNAPADEDPYADPQYQVPDDLVW
ncbi:DUF2058 family protein [Lysobacter sp. BMK333-48F3]|uniref:DUF2058 domain-containing protein n=1 Tax=Lysobacter sp. BMK333-48F3 TaxID=2867962 RepID=UPI001C8B4B9C|nr:DUF2058 family protein [Lysobacter sp. BMK333-48F3]MBX9403315.1 DUF2058 family protein [Lysobacter sp. BMK333-48F3]